jgi:hypothetical protein
LGTGGEETASSEEAFTRTRDAGTADASDAAAKADTSTGSTGLACATGWAKNPDGTFATTSWHYVDGTCLGDATLCAFEQQMQAIIVAQGLTVPSTLNYIQGSDGNYWFGLPVFLDNTGWGLTADPTVQQNLFNAFQGLNPSYSAAPIDASLAPPCNPFNPTNQVSAGTAIEVWDPLCQNCVHT